METHAWRGSRPDGRGFVAGIVFGAASIPPWNGPTAKPLHLLSRNGRDVFKEYRNTIHYSNRSGVRATCPDCHVPKDWTHKIIRKIQASNRVYHHLLGSIDTPEKFNAKRLQLAQNEWRRMKKTDSRECRNCHNFEYFDYMEQRSRSAKMHQDGLGEGKTCIDCHKGIAHSLPAIEQEIGADKGGVAPEIFHPPVAPAE